jgi:hypothetical protein
MHQTDGTETQTGASAGVGEAVSKRPAGKVVASKSCDYLLEDELDEELEVKEPSAWVTAYCALITAYCAACALVLPVEPFSNVPGDDPNKPLVSAVPGKLNSEEMSEAEELDDVPDTSELSVWEMAYSTWRNAF